MRFRFADRTDAGRQLAAKLVSMALDRPVVYALPRGGVPVALEIARALRAPLDLVLVRKIGAPGEPELALGAVVEGDPPETVINDDVRRAYGADDAYIEHARQRLLAELERRRALYLGSRPRLAPAGCTAIIVDDGLATGATARAALSAVKRQGAAKTVLAIPVAQQQALNDMREHADSVVCLQAVRRFAGVGAFYADFHQLTDDETVGLLRLSIGRAPEPPRP
jgi:predicted phosphoribosyltransferase